MTSQTVVDRVYNFSAGPAVLPLPVLEQVQRELVALPGCGASVLEISHRSKPFGEILCSTEQRLRELLNVPSDYKILFLQGGARLQFSMVPMNLLGTGQTAGYLLTGSWGLKALAEAKKVGQTAVVWDGKSTEYDRLPPVGDWSLEKVSAYLHLTSNETIQGVQLDEDLAIDDVPLVCDASSDFLWRPMDIRRYGLIYACAQKNAGPAGLTVVIIRSDLLSRSSDALPGYLNYREHAEQRSLYNTPPTFAVYVMNLVAKWLQKEVGGLAEMQRRNLEQAEQLYQVIDASTGFYRGHAQPDSRSAMNVVFRLPNDSLQEEFLAEAAERNMEGLRGHRSVGGIRASIYNAMPAEGVQALCDFMVDFRDRRAQ